MTDTNQFDVVVIGAGHNGLVSAAYLAESGLKVLVLESSGTIGGAARTCEFSEGYRVSECAHLVYALHPTIVRDLKLTNYGLRYAATDLGTISLGSDGLHVLIKGDSVSGDISYEDADSYRKFRSKMIKFCQVFATTLEHQPPRLMNGSLGDKLSLLKLGWQVRKLGKTDMQELLRIGSINIYDVLEERFDNQLLKGALCLDAVLGSHTGPRSPNTVLAYLYRHVGETFGFNGPSIPLGGMGTVVEAIAASAKSSGAELRTSSKVEKILTEGSKVVGVRLETGEEIKTHTVVSNADPRATFSSLVGYPQLDTEFSRRVHNIRMKGNTAKLHLALDSRPRFTGVGESETGNRLVIAPDSDYVERAFNHAKYKEYSDKPIVEISIPSIHDSTLAPAGKHVLSAVVQYAPHNLQQGWSQASDTFKNLLIDLIEDYAPGIRQQIVASELLTPADIESRFGTTNGHWHHGELALDQFLMLRPFPGMSQYATPVHGLYHCSAGSHPGGNVLGMVGRNCARAVIKRGDR
ncbi:MAG: NAD(P)/FAD-dependent oxidoreductase [bacterium]|nr:NAD(P)/FAD-dependent oxidoreductase [Gammaproteobacteria bacterium]